MKSIWQLFIAHEKDQDVAAVAALENLKIVEEQLKGKKFFHGETIGYLDLAFGWIANLVSIIEEIMSLKLVDGERFPHLSSWIQNFMDAPVIRDCWPPRDKMIIKYQVGREKHLAAATPK